MSWIIFFSVLLFLVYALLIVADVAVAIHVKAFKSCNPCFVTVCLVLALLTREI